MNDDLKRIAIETRTLYRTGAITLDDVKVRLKDYIVEYNKLADALAKKYNQRPKYFNLLSFLR